MKKIKTIVVAATLLFATSAFATAGPEKVNAKVKAAFENSFTGAVNVNWEKNENFYFASFTLNSSTFNVAYNENGELVGVSREIATTQLPVNVSLALKDRYKDYIIADTVTEMNYEGATSYIVRAENSKQILKLKCSTGGDIVVNNKVKK